jgi:hypothetical protein
MRVSLLPIMRDSCREPEGRVLIVRSITREDVPTARL